MNKMSSCRNLTQFGIKCKRRTENGPYCYQHLVRDPKALVSYMGVPYIRPEKLIEELPGRPAFYNEVIEKDKKSLVWQDEERVSSARASFNDSTIIPIPDHFLRVIQEYITRRKCDISKTFTGTKILTWGEKKSTSSSIIIRGNFEINGSEYPSLVKIDFDSYDIFNTRGIVERGIYKHIIPELLLHTPHLLHYYGDYTCKTIELGDEKRVQQFSSVVGDIFNQDTMIKQDKMNCLFLERSEGKSLKEIVSMMSSDDLYLITFQVLFTLKCFERYNMIHGDLHMGNVLIEELPIEKNIFYDFGGKVYASKISKIAKIFDFDLSRVYDRRVPRNFALDEGYCANGYCNGNDTSFDLYLILINIYISNKHGDFNHTISKMIPKDSMPDWTKGISDSSKRKCLPLEECLQLLLDQLVRRGLFEETKIINPLYVYKFPNKKEIEIRVPKISFSLTGLESLKEKMSTILIFRDIVKNVWARECVERLNFDNFAYAKKLYRTYSKQRGKNQTAVAVCYYLSFPMFYKMSREMIIKCLTINELEFLSDISKHVTFSPLPFI